MTGPYIRLARREELAEVGEMSYRSYVPLFSNDPGFDEIQFAASPYGRELRDVAAHAQEADCIAIALLGDKIVGAVHYIRSYSDGNPGFRKLATDPAAQKYGIGELLVRWCMEQAHHEGHKVLALHTTDWMQAAQRLYHRLGFVRAPSLDHEVSEKVRVLAFTLDLGSCSWSTLVSAARRVGALLKKSKQTVAVSESACGGLISAALLAVPGSSAFYKAAHVVYSRDGQSVYTPDIVERVRSGELKYGGEEMVLARAALIAKTFDASWGIGEASQTGPTFLNVRGSGPTGEKMPLEQGEARSWVGVARSWLWEGEHHQKAIFLRNPGVIDRESNMFTFAQRALELLEHTMQTHTPSKL